MISYQSLAATASNFERLYLEQIRVLDHATTHTHASVPTTWLAPHLDSWAELPLDPYLSAGFRRRRLTRFQIDQDLNLRALPEAQVSQSRANNRLFGGMARRFSGLSAELRDSLGLRALLDGFLGQLPFSPAGHVLWVHQIRITARPGNGACPVVEGVHRDERKYVGVYVAAKQGVFGERTQLYYERDGAPFWSRHIRVGELIMFYDPRLYHFTTPFTTMDAAGGTRDILILAVSEGQVGVV